MGVRILTNRTNDLATLYDSVTDWAFGPVISDDGAYGADDRAEAFCRWLKVDARSLTEDELHQRYYDWLAQEDEQRTREERVS